MAKQKGWLDKYGEEINANEGSSSASKEWMGEGYSNVGRNYSPAWGGQFEDGGYIPQAQTGLLTPTTGDTIHLNQLTDQYIKLANSRNLKNTVPSKPSGALKALFPDYIKKGGKSYKYKKPIHKSQIGKETEKLNNKQQEINRFALEKGIKPTSKKRLNQQSIYYNQNGMSTEFLETPNEGPYVDIYPTPVQTTPVLQQENSVPAITQPVQNVPQGHYRVEYFDPELKQETHRMFMTQAESDAFAKELGQRNLTSGVPATGNITQRYDQFAMGGELPQAQKGKKVIVDGKEYDTSSEEYKDLYRWGPNDDGKGGIGYFDKDGVLVTGKTTLPEVVVFPKDKDTKKFYDDLGDSDQYAFEQMVKKYGPVNITKNKGKGIFSGTAGHYNPFTDQITIDPNQKFLSRDNDTYLAELAHKVQFDRQGKFDVMGNWVFNDLPDYMTGNSPYEDSSTTEYQAHSIIEPTLKDEFFNYSSDDMMGYNYNKFNMGGSLPGSVGFTYARTNSPAPSNGPYAKKTKASAQNGETIHPINLRLPKYEKPKPFFTGYGFSQNPVNNVNVYGVGAYGTGNISDRLNLSGSVNSASVFYPGGNKMFMNPRFEVGMKYKFNNGGSMSYYQNGLDWKPKSISRDGSVIKAQTGEKVRCGDNQVYLEGTGCIDIRSRLYKELYESGKLVQQNPDESVVFPTMKPLVINSKLTEDQKRALLRKDMQETSAQNQTQISSADQPWYQRAWDIATHPGTAIRAYNKTGYVPSNLSAAADDMGGSSSIINTLSPATWVKGAVNATKQLGSSPIQTPIDLLAGAGNLAGYGIHSMDRALPGQTKPEYTSPFGDADVLTVLSEYKRKFGKDYPKKLTEFLNKAYVVPGIGVGIGTALGIDAYEAEQYKQGGVVKDNRGYWNPNNWGKVVEIDSPDITMEGVDQDLIGISDEGDVQYMTPGKNYKFKGKKVREYPVGKNGVNQQDEKVYEQLDQLTNFTNYNKPTKRGWLDKYN